MSRVVEMIKRGQMGDGQTYEQKIRNLFGSALVGYWPLWEASGAVAADISGNGYNGAYSNVTLGQAGIGDGRTSANFDSGNPRYVNINAAIPGINTAEGALSFFMKQASGFWSDTTIKYIFRLYVDASNYIACFKTNATGSLEFHYVAGGVDKVVYFGSLATDWAQYDCSWSKSGNVMSVYQNGSLIGSATGLGNWAGTLGANTTIICAQNKFNDSPFFGNSCHWRLMNRPITAAEALTASICSPLSLTRIAFFGDSVTVHAAYGSWAELTATAYRNGLTRIYNHAVAGTSIASGLSTQVTAAANDNADIGIFAMGTNDDNAGNMTTLQATAEAQIAAFQSSNPHATIYWMNVLPRWANNTTGAEVDKSNIRAAIVAAGAAQGVTVWDAYTWLAQNKTSDGLHPIAAGHRDIEAQAIALL